MKTTPTDNLSAPVTTARPLRADAQRNVAKLLESPTDHAIDHGDFYVSFEILIAK